MSEAVLRAENVGRSVGAARIVSDVSLAVTAGESLALSGPSGSGKTTLLMLLGLLDRPTTGRILVEGTAMSQASARDRAWLRLTRIGFVFQEKNLVSNLTARENVALPAWRLSGSRSRALEAASEGLAKVGLAHRADALASVLSTGEAQRVSVARALVNRPLAVLADEPTGSLDPESAALALEALFAVPKSGAALVVVTHDPAVAARAARALTMRGGVLEGPAA